MQPTRGVLGQSASPNSMLAHSRGAIPASMLLQTPRRDRACRVTRTGWRALHVGGHGRERAEREMDVCVWRGAHGKDLDWGTRATGFRGGKGQRRTRYGERGTRGGG